MASDPYVAIEATVDLPVVPGTENLTPLVPRVRRAIDGPAADSASAPAATLTDAQVLALAADAIADVLFYTSGRWGHKLLVVERDPDYDAPSKWAVDPPLEAEEETVVVAQAALNFFFFQFAGKKVQERISDEAQSWEYTLSATLLRDQLKLLQDMRDRALAVLERQGAPLDAFESFLAVRDSHVARHVEAWYSAPGMGGQNLDWRFLGP